MKVKWFLVSRRLQIYNTKCVAFQQLIKFAAP